MTTYEKNLHKLVSHCTANANLAAAVCKLVDTAPLAEQPELFVRFLFEFRYTPTDRKCNVYEEFAGDYEKELVNAKVTLDEFIDKSKKLSLTENEFHRKLWEFICDCSKNDKRKKCLLFVACSQCKELPYVDKTKAMTMTQKEFEEEEEQIDPVYKAKIRHIANQGFDQITEDASMFLPILDKGKNEKEKAILLSLILMSFRSKIRFPVPSFSGLLDDDEND